MSLGHGQLRAHMGPSSYPGAQSARKPPLHHPYTSFFAKLIWDDFLRNKIGAGCFFGRRGRWESGSGSELAQLMAPKNECNIRFMWFSTIFEHFNLGGLISVKV